MLSNFIYTIINIDIVTRKTRCKINIDQYSIYFE